MPDPERPKRLRVKTDKHNSWAFTCPLCGKGFGYSLLFRHIHDHRYGRWGYEQVNIDVEVTMLVPDPEPTHDLVSMGVPPPVPFDQLPADVQAEAFDSEGNIAPLDYDG